MSNAEFKSIYDRTASVHIDRETDLNTACLERIYTEIVGRNVLELGCGRGFLCRQLAQRGFTVTGLDMRIPEAVRSESADVMFIEANIECLPFVNSKFDTVICTHTLEHVQNFYLAVSELRRVAAKRLIVVVPKQRNYLYTFDLHIHFFPYPHDLMRDMGKHGISQSCGVEGGDLFYVEHLVAEN
jgi:ubiquinone/menaquinone biosynthesis C-methylase UbiE